MIGLPYKNRICLDGKQLTNSTKKIVYFGVPRMQTVWQGRTIQFRYYSCVPHAEKEIAHELTTSKRGLLKGVPLSCFTI